MHDRAEAPPAELTLSTVITAREWERPAGEVDGQFSRIVMAWIVGSRSTMTVVC
jgi:hypothetical protein